MAAYMKISGYAQLLQVYACGVENVNGGYVRTTKHELIGRIPGSLVQLHVIVYWCYAGLNRFISLANEGNERERWFAIACILVAWYTMLFGKPLHNGTGGNALILILLVDWILCLIWPEDTDVSWDE